MTPVHIIKELMNDNVEILDVVWDLDIEEFWVGIQLSMRETPPIKNVPKLIEPSTNSLPFSEVFNLIQTAQNIKPDLMDNLLENMALRSNPDEWNLWYRRILMKTLPKWIPMGKISYKIALLYNGKKTI